MTIGIGAFGRNAGQAIVAGLAAVERESRGAIGGFVSLAVITQSGRLERAEAQAGGSVELFGGMDMPASMAEAPLAVVMSSGPNRPEPLSQFTPGAADTGLVTGHRFPNMPGVDGQPMNLVVLDLMAQGRSAKSAVEEVVRTNAAADAGFIALSKERELFLCNTPLVEERRDYGGMILRSDGQDAAVAVLHNAIHPKAVIAALACEIAMDVMYPANVPTGHIFMKAGTPLRIGPHSGVKIDENGETIEIIVVDERYLNGSCTIGLGDHVQVMRGREPFGFLAGEPFMVAKDARLISVDGMDELPVPVCD